MIKIQVKGNDFDFGQIEKVGGRVDLWNYHFDLSLFEQTVYECNALQAFTQVGGHLVFWLPLTWIHKCEFAPADIARDWWCVGSVFTATQVGYVYQRAEKKPRDAGCKRFFQERDAQKSSVIAKWLIERFCAPNAVVVDVTMDKSAHLAKWAKRSSVHYFGNATNDADRKEIEKMLAQVELPMVQESLFHDESSNQSQ